MKFQIRPASNEGRTGYRVHFSDAKNGKTILWSQVYSDKQDALKAIALSRAHAATAPVEDLTAIRRAS